MYDRFMKKVPGILKNRILRAAALASVILMVMSSILFALPEDIYAITLRELGNSIAKLGRDEENLVEEIVVSEAEVENKKNKIRSLNEELEDLESQLYELSETKRQLSQSIDSKKGSLKKKIVFSYKYANDDVARLIVSAGDMNEIIRNIYLFKNVMERQANIIEELRFEREEYDRITRKSEEKKKEIEVARDIIKEEEEQLEKSIKENRALLEKVKGEKSEIQNILSEIKRRIAMVQPPGLTLAGEWDMTATAYYAFGRGGNDINGNGITAIGLRARKGVVAVDPRVIPLGTKLYIPGYGEALAGDTGGWIKGNRIDLCFETQEECFRWGRRSIKIYLVED
ncbi:MAG: 3D domain-containing protein [Actinomycetota bacterium]|nr:3D domain-containing protein [Actinomycetota bacterium]